MSKKTTHRRTKGTLAVVETVEPRTLLSGTIYGTTGNDTILLWWDYNNGDICYSVDNYVDDIHYGGCIPADEGYGGQSNSAIIIADDGDDWIENGSVFPVYAYGGNGGDYFQGNATEVINEHFEGGAGPDGAYGGPGNDYLVGGDGDDVLRGDEGNDYIAGDAGDDRLEEGSNWGNDTIDGGDGDDTIGGAMNHNDAGSDLIYSGNGTDWIYALDWQPESYNSDTIFIRADGSDTFQIDGGDSITYY